jgi:hypothetical protein
MKVPADVQIKATIRTGSVYYFPDDAFKSDEPHYFIVMNVDPLNDPFVCLVVSSAQIDKVRRRRWNCSSKTLIEISPKEYQGSPRQSIIDCNEVYERSIDELVHKLSEGVLEFKPEMSERLVERLRQGIFYSDIVEKRKRLRICSDSDE